MRCFLRACSLPSIVVDVLNVNLDAKCDLDVSETLPTGVIDVKSTVRGDFYLIDNRCDEFSINNPSSAKDVFWLALRLFNTLHEVWQLLYCANRLRSDAWKFAARAQ